MPDMDILLERHMRRMEFLAGAYENEAVVMSTEELEAIYDNDVFEAMELQEESGNQEVEMLGEAVGESITNSTDFIFSYAEPKFKHECTHCGFEADLYDSGAEHECPICRQGTMCRPTQDLTWYQDRDSNWPALQEGFYAGGEVTGIAFPAYSKWIPMYQTM